MAGALHYGDINELAGITAKQTKSWLKQRSFTRENIDDEGQTCCIKRCGPNPVPHV